MAAIRVRGSVKRRTDRILTDEERKSSHSRSLQYSSQKTVARLIEYTTKHYGARHRGGLLNVGSMAGFLPGPGMAVYYATKAYVLSFTEALHSELAPRGIRVTVLCPGPVPTEFAARAGISDRSMAPSLLTKSADYVAEAGYRGLMEGRWTIVPGFINSLVTVFVRILPRRLLLKAVDSRQRRRRAAPDT